MEASNHPRMEVMAAPKKSPDEIRDRAISLVRHLVDSSDDAMTVTGECRRVQKHLGVNTYTLRNWVEQVPVDDPEPPGMPTGERLPGHAPLSFMAVRHRFISRVTSGKYGRLRLRMILNAAGCNQKTAPRGDPRVRAVDHTRGRETMSVRTRGETVREEIGHSA
jgi:hypothetical protein